MTITPKERAERAAKAMWSEDDSSAWMGMRLVEVDEGWAVAELTVERHHINGHGICHGGVIYSLADTAFAFACNSRNHNTYAMHNMISYLRPGRQEDLLRAEAREISLTGRNGIYDVQVINQNEEVVAEFRGVSRAVSGHLFEEEKENAQ